MNITIEDPTGFPDTIGNDLDRADGRHADDCQINYDEGRQVVTVYAASDAAAKWLYDWLEETREHYRREYVDAEPYHDAAQQLASAVYDEMEGSDGRN